MGVHLIPLRFCVREYDENITYLMCLQLERVARSSLIPYRISMGQSRGGRSALQSHLNRSRLSGDISTKRRWPEPDLLAPEVWWFNLRLVDQTRAGADPFCWSPASVQWHYDKRGLFLGGGVGA